MDTTKNRKVVFEDSNSISEAIGLLNPLIEATDSILFQYRFLNIKSDITISELISIRTERVEDFVSQKIISLQPQTSTINGMEIDKSALGKMIRIPDCSKLAYAISSLDKIRKDLSYYKGSAKLHGFYNGWTGLIQIKENHVVLNEESFQVLCDRHLRVILTDDNRIKDHEQLLAVCNFINDKVIAKDGNPDRWQYPDTFKDLFSFNVTTKRMEINPNHFTS